MGFNSVFKGLKLTDRRISQIKDLCNRISQTTRNYGQWLDRVNLFSTKVENVVLTKQIPKVPTVYWWHLLYLWLQKNSNCFAITEQETFVFHKYWQLQVNKRQDLFTVDFSHPYVAHKLGETQTIK